MKKKKLNGSMGIAAAILAIASGASIARADTPSCEPKYVDEIQKHQSATSFQEGMSDAALGLSVTGSAQVVSSYNPAGLATMGAAMGVSTTAGVSANSGPDSLRNPTSADIISGLDLIRQARMGDGPEVRALTARLASAGVNTSRGDVAAKITALDAAQAYCQGDSLMTVQQIEDLTINQITRD